VSALVTMATTFGESAVLLVIGAILAALLTGIVAPFAVQQVNRRRLADQTRFEENLRQESAFIATQAQFIKDLAGAVFAFEATALRLVRWSLRS
jgi:uncharacterized membrane protein YjgN (DUF898 family)